MMLAAAVPVAAEMAATGRHALKIEIALKSLIITMAPGMLITID